MNKSNRFIELIIISIVLFWNCGHALGQAVLDAHNEVIVKVDNDGTVRDKNFRFLGMIKPDGVIVNHNNSRIGKIARYGQFYDRNYNILGNIDDEGNVRDHGGILLGTVDSDGMVRSVDGALLGTAVELPASYAALFFFFNVFTLVE